MSGLTRILNKAFRDGMASVEYFTGWTREKPREFWSRTDSRGLGVELQLGKWWEAKGGQAAVNLWCGHRWEVPGLGWREDGFDYLNRRLSRRDDQDHWWDIASEEDVRRFQGEMVTLLNDVAFPWFEQVGTREGYCQWVAARNPGPGHFPYLLELQGAGPLRKALREWLQTCPRSIDTVMKWLVSVKVLAPDMAEQLQLASIQDQKHYEERLGPLLEELDELV